MKCLISGHRKSKLQSYDLDWIKEKITWSLLDMAQYEHVIGLSGMADGIDLMFCEALLYLEMAYHCYIPFDGQDEYMSEEDKARRTSLIDNSYKVFTNTKNSKMVADADAGIIVWDGNKGGTHNVFQQMLENKKSFVWIEPHNKIVTKIALWRKE